MAERPAESSSLEGARYACFMLTSAGLIVAALYLGQRIFVPLALAILLTLLLTPVVSRLERGRLGRFPAVLSVVCLAFALIGLVGWAVATQFANLIDDLPQHKANVREKIIQLRGSGKPGLLGTAQDIVEEVENAREPTADAPGASASPPSPVIHVELQKPSLFSQLQAVAGRVLGNITLLVAVILLVITLLLYREDTRNRLIRLAGRGRLTVTTRALDEAARRIGGYLLGHSAVNAGFGVAIGLGLAALEVPYPALWGLLAGVFRFIPSIGVWLVVPLPVALTLISNPGFVVPLLVLGLFLTLDLLTANLIEPWVCGRSVGLAPVPLLLAVMFWTGLWGVVGLVLATPMTVCLAVLGKYIPQLSFLSVLLSKEAALRPAARYYQRLLARDRREAEVVVKEYLVEHSMDELFDRVLLPALVLIRRSRKAGELRPEDEEFILHATREIVDGLGGSTTSTDHPVSEERLVVLGVPATDGADEVALHMLRHLVRTDGVDIEVTSGGFAAPNTSALVQGAVLVAALGPGGLTEARYLCRRLRAQHPEVKIVVGRWGCGRDPKKARRLLLGAGAYRVSGTLREARTELVRVGRPLSPLHLPAQRTV
ncbi:MAG: AI-2E family transporter [Planctomycetia bacterium]|nr:AI-2E family transporter [Planctomycetia bacterium]